MKTMEMSEAVTYYRKCRNRLAGNLDYRNQVGCKYCLPFSLALTFFSGLVFYLFAAILPVANWGFIGWSDNPIGLAWRVALLSWAVSWLFYPFVRRSKKLKRQPKAEFSLVVGTSTGRLTERQHGASTEGGQLIALKKPDACKNIRIEGGIGQGKTRGAILPLLIQLLDQQCGGLIFDIKANFKKAVDEAAMAAGIEASRVHYIGPGLTQMNLCHGLSPEVAASNLTSALMLTEQKTGDSIWANTVNSWARATFGILSYIPEHYSINGVYRYIFDPEFHGNINVEAQYILDNLDDDEERRKLESYLEYEENIFASFDDDRFTGNVRASFAQVLEPFIHPEMTDAFCKEPKDQARKVEMSELLNGKIIVLDLPLARWGLAAKVAYTFIKLRFFNLMQERLQYVNQDDLPVFFLCDEYQNLINANPNALSDYNFWDKSREANCIGIVSWQGLSSIYAAIGNHDIADSIMQHFRQHLVFLSEDKNTIREMETPLGKVDIEQSSEAITQALGNLLGDKSKTQSKTKVNKGVLDPQLFRTLKENEAVAILNINNVAVDDVIEVPRIIQSKQATAIGRSQQTSTLETSEEVIG